MNWLRWVPRGAAGFRMVLVALELIWEGLRSMFVAAWLMLRYVILFIGCLLAITLVIWVVETANR
jgi:hypothetical protein